MNEWMNGYWVLLKKKVRTRASRESLHLFQQNVVFFMSEKKRKKNLILFHPLFLLHTQHNYYLILSVKCVCSFFFSRARWTTATACKLEAMFNHVLKLENVNIYITYLTSILNSYQWNVESVFFLLFSISFVVIVLKTPFLTSIWIAKKKKK